jgi:hypothetical protein
VEHDGHQGDQDHPATNAKKAGERTSDYAAEQRFGDIAIILVRHVSYDALTR